MHRRPGSDGQLRTRQDRRAFLLNLICFAACIEGLFFYGAFAYVYFLRSRGLLNGLASGTNWVFRDESMHMAFAFDVVDTDRREEPELWDDELAGQVGDMVAEAVECEYQFAEDLLGRWRVRHEPDRTCAPIWSTWRTGVWNCSAFPPGTARPIRSPSWSCRTCKSCRTSSNDGCRPISWG